MHRLTTFLSLLLAFSASCGAQSSAAPRNPSETYLRIVNLLPIQSPKIDLFRGEDRYLMGMKAGFFQNYLPVPRAGGSGFSVKQGDQIIGNITIPSGGSRFFTLAIYGSKANPEIVLMDDEPAKRESDTAGEPTPTPKPRLRLYVGGYDFPVKVRAKNVGEWTVQETALITEAEVTGVPPEVVEIDFVDKYNQKITLNFPTDFKSSRCYSAFVSQRGLKRPRILAYPDNTMPEEDPLAATDAAATPIPTPEPAPEG